MKTRLYKFVIVVNTILILYPVRTYNMLDEGCRLYNGLYGFEGIAQVNIRGSWTSICKTNFTQQAAEHFCSEPTVYERNFFGTNETADAIWIHDCFNDTGVDCLQNSSYVNSKCEHAAICCQGDLDKDKGCSGDWKYVNKNNADIIITHERPSFLNVFYLKDIEDARKFWTKSAFKDITKPTNSSLPDDEVVKSCFKDCLEKNEPFKQLTVKNETCDFQLTPDAENSRTFEHTEDVTDTDILLCIVAEIENSTLILTAEDCNKTYRNTFFKKLKFEIPTKPPPTTSTTNLSSKSQTDISTVHGVTSELDHTADALNSKTASELKKWGYYFIASVSVVLIVIGVIVGYVTYRVRKINRSGQEEGKDSYTANKTYASRMPLHRPNSGDDYANILDSEIDMIDLSAGSIKPPLPYREGGDVVTLDQYSTPHDTLESTLQDEYSFTYDDPIRINQSNDEKQSKRSGKKQSLKKTTTLNSNEKNEETLNFKTESNDQCTSATNDKQCVKVNTEIVDTDIDADLKQKEGASSDRKSEYEITVMSSDNNTVRIRRDSGDDNSTSDKSEYEITSITNSEDGTTKTRMFTEHVCLDCLSAEHLKAFGITIVPDDNCYSLCKDVTKRFSAPCTGTQILGGAETPGNKTVSMSVDDSIVSTRENLPCSGGIETCSDQSTCSVCHSVYDRIGKYNRNNWIKYTDNVYQKFGHFHTPRHGVGKRVNST